MPKRSQVLLQRLLTLLIEQNRVNLRLDYYAELRVVVSPTRVRIPDFVVFEGGDEADSTSYLQYARLPAQDGTSSVTPLVVVEHPRYPLPTVDLEQGGYIVFAGQFGAPAVAGLYLHGPLEKSF